MIKSIKEKLQLEYCIIDLQLVEILTKHLEKERFGDLKKLIRMETLANMN